MHAPTRSCRPFVPLGAACLLLCLGGIARAQTHEFVLDEGRRWSEVEPNTARALDDEIARARRHLAEDNPGRALKILNAWIERHKESADPHLAEAYLLRADARTARGDEFKALYDYETVIRAFPQSDSFRVAVERELEIGLKYIDGYRRKLWGMRIATATAVGEEILIRVQERTPGSATAERAAIALADYYYDRREMELARDAYDLYVLNHPNGPNRMKAEMRRIFAEVARFKGPRYDSSGLLNARIKISNFAARYPAEAARRGLNDALINRIDESMAAQMLETARWYLELRDEASARFTLRRLIDAYPDTFAAEEALSTMTRRGWIAPDSTTAPEGAGGTPETGDDTRAESRAADGEQ